jgi:CBS domain-containing protein
MTEKAVTVDPNDKLQVADDVMRLGRIRHMPVVDEEGALVGMVTQRDLFHNALLKALGYGTRAQREALDMVRVKDAMSSPVVTVSADVPLVEAARMMRDRKIGCLVVTEGDAMRGILTEGDFVSLIAEGGG